MAELLPVSRESTTVTDDGAVQLTATAPVERVVPAGKVLGLDGKLRPRVRTDNTDRDSRIRIMRARGDSLRQIARVVGVSVGTAHRVAKDAER